MRAKKLLVAERFAALSAGTLLLGVLAVVMPFQIIASVACIDAKIAREFPWNVIVYHKQNNGGIPLATLATQGF